MASGGQGGGLELVGEKEGQQRALTDEERRRQQKKKDKKKKDKKLQNDIEKLEAENVKKEEEIKGTVYEYADDVMEGFAYIYQTVAYAGVKTVDGIKQVVYPVKEGLLDAAGKNNTGTQGNPHGGAYQQNAVNEGQTFAMDN